MNRIEDRLRTLIRYLARNSDFDVYGVELDYYEYEDKRIVVPELYGTEVQSRASRSDDLQKATEGDLYDKFQEMLDERVAGRADVDFAGQNNYRQVLMDGVDSDIHLEWNFERIEGEDHVTVRADFECDDATVNKKLLEQFVKRHLDRYEEELGESIEPHRRGSKWRRFYVARPASVGDVLHDQTLQEWAVETMHGLLLLLREDIEEELRMAWTATEENE